MGRRRLRVICSSDEEEEERSPPPPPTIQTPYEEEPDDIIIDDIETDFHTVTLNSSNTNPTPNTNSSTNNSTNIGRRFSSEPIHLDLSDNDEMIIDNNSNYNGANDSNHMDDSSYFGVSDSPINGFLERIGLRLKKEWLDSCLIGLQSTVGGFYGLDDTAKAKLCFEQFLTSDLNYCGAGVLPPSVHTLHLVDLKGPFVLQVDEIVNISCPLLGRYQNAAPGNKRCLKLSMTDGVQRVFGMEYKPIKDLQVLTPVGLKIAVLNVSIRHGLLMLVPEVLQVLGGFVDELDAARQRLVNEINKPPRGKRNRNGVLPPLATRAILAAWPSENSTQRPTRGQGTGFGIPTNDSHRHAPGNGNNAEPNTSSAPRPQEHVTVPRHSDRPVNIPRQYAGQDLPCSGTAFVNPVINRSRKQFAVPFSRNIAELNSASAVQPQERATVPPHFDRTPTMPVQETGTAFIFSANDKPKQEFVASASMNMAERSTWSAAQARDCDNISRHADGPAEQEDATVTGIRDNAEPNTSSAIDIDAEETPMVDVLGHPIIFSRDKEIPFTYLASLSAKLGAIQDSVSIVKGRIKCFLTGVKGFQYRNRTQYELRVYVDDGSLISEILIDHNVVQSRIGFSPQEVTSALASSDAKQVSEMKETLKQFQTFIVKYEGTLLVHLSKSSPPVAVEMKQGCRESDAKLLLNRLKYSISAQPQNRPHLEPIELSP